MKEMQLNFSGWQRAGVIFVDIDGNSAELKKGKSGNLVCNYKTENDKVKIRIYRLLDVGGIFWFLTKLIFFVISIFGIFDAHHKERCIVIDYEAEVELKDINTLNFMFYPAKENFRAIEVQTTLKVLEYSNVYHLDEKSKRTLKILKISKLFLSLGIIAVIIAALVINFT